MNVAVPLAVVPLLFCAQAGSAPPEVPAVVQRNAPLEPLAGAANDLTICPTV